MNPAQSASRKSRPGRYMPATDAAMAFGILLLGLSLAASGGNLLQRWRSSTARQQVLSFEDQLGIIANTAALIVITWWLISFLIAIVWALLQHSGRSGAAAATAKFSPAFMRRLAVAALGFQLLAAPLATAATLPSPDPQPRPAVSALWTPTATAPGGLVLPLPLRSLAAPASPAPPAAGTAAGPALPSTAAAPAPDPALPSPGPSPAASPPWIPPAPAVAPGTLAARQLRTDNPEVGGAEVTVRAGDSLWSLAASRLGPLASDVDIAAEWPRLYQANRSVVGDNPDLLHPGQVLRLPARE
jgi:uncharacterized membrane protein YtjA (UPF0391 family)